MKRVIFHLTSFLRRVRIHGGEFDSSARAMNQAEQVRLLQAEPRIVRGSTIERKQMSTKTTFKRIALVAVAALGFGLISVAPSSAAPSDFALFPTVSALSTPATASIGDPVVGTFNQSGVVNSFGGNSLYTKAYLVAIPVTSALAPNSVSVATYSGSAYTQTSGTIATVTHTGPNFDGGFDFDFDYNGAQQIENNPSLGFGTKRINGYFTATFTPDKAGTYVVAVKSLIDPTQVITWSVTAAAKAPATTAATTAVVFNSFAGVGDDTVGVSGPKADINGQYNEIGYIDVTVSNGATSGALAPADGKPISATVSGPGNVYWQSGGSYGRAVTSGGGSLTERLYIDSDGTAGKTTITITDGSFTKTKVVNFYGAAASYKVGDTTPDPVVSALGVGNTQSWDISTLDANGITVSTSPTLYAVSSDTSILTVSTAAGSVTATGVKAGSATFTICDKALCASPTVKLGPIAVTVTNKKADSATFTLNKSDYQVGEAFTLTITAKDAAGVLADDSYAAMATLTTSVLVPGTNGNPISGTVNPSFTNGVATVKGFMPAFTGPITFTLTLGVKGTPGVADAAAGAKFTAVAAVSSLSADTALAATDAANEAIDAANAATDAALAAAEAADAATSAAQEASDAIAALSESVTQLIAGLQAQITSLAAVLKKVAAATAKIQAQTKKK